MSRPVATFGHETFSSTAAISARSSQAAASSASSSPLEPITFVISGTGSSASCGQVLLEVAREALVRQPDRVDHAAGRLPQPRRRLPARGASVIVLETKALNGKPSSSASPNARRAAIASNVPEPLMIACSSSMPAEVDQCAGTSASSAAAKHRPVDADPRVAALGAAA